MKNLIIYLAFFIISTSTLLAQNKLKFKKVEFNNRFSHFLTCFENYDSTFSGIDSIMLNYKEKNVKLLLYIEKGMKKKALAYFENNQKCRETNFNGFERHGIDIEWYIDGKISYMCYFENDKEKSPMLKWYNNGQLHQITNSLINDKQVGIEWSESGNLISETFSIDSTNHGFTEKYYFENGQILSIGHYNAGKQPFISFYENGRKNKEGSIFNLGICKIGKWGYWFKNGIKAREESYKDDEPNVKDGVWKWWNEKGRLLRVETYKDGVLIKKEIKINDVKD
jgi:antitoxin component YwqK of YwqJK toxin-antitoxin module